MGGVPADFRTCGRAIAARGVKAGSRRAHPKCCRTATGPNYRLRHDQRISVAAASPASALLDEPFTGAEAAKKDGRVRLLEHLDDEAGSARAPFSSRAGVNKVHAVELFTKDHGRRAPANRGAEGGQ